MNFLAHIFLSGSDPATICGNFIGDGVKGRQAEDYSLNVQTGIALHRFIDEYTDNHPITAPARQLIRPEFRKYSGVVLDVYFDHFLSANWSDYHDERLESFVQRIHLVLEDFRPKMPPRTERFYDYMRAHNWLVNYRDLKALNTVFTGMSRRASFESNMEKGVPVLKTHYSDLEDSFNAFFPQLEQAASEFLAQHRDSST